ncbi:MAG: dUTP diphosphatase [Methanomassiliicoccales archaeon]
MNQVVVKISLLPAAGDLSLPEYMSSGASGMDLRACISEPLVIPPGKRNLIPTGLCVAIPWGYEGQVRPRSGLANREGVTVLNTPGTIDADYRGEIKVVVINLGEDNYLVNRGDRIAQLVICPVVMAELQLVDELPTSERGAGGFGHTGHS